jgi:hypothetical protein
MYGACGWSYCNRLVDLYRSWMTLMRSLLALLPLMELSVALLRLTFYVFLLLLRSLLKQMRPHNVTLPLSLSVCLLR